MENILKYIYMGAVHLFVVVHFEELVSRVFLRPKRNSGRVVANCCFPPGVSRGLLTGVS